MSKNILLQIVNKLNLPQKDKNNLVNIINNNKGGNSEIPDWNVKNGEPGYIKNKTHGFDTILTISKPGIYNIEGERPYSIYAAIDNHNVALNVDEEIFIQQGPPIIAKLYYIDAVLHVEIIDDYNRINNDRPLIIHREAKKLNDIFLNETICRVSDYENPHIKFNLYDSEHNLNVLNIYGEINILCEIENLGLEAAYYNNGTITGFHNSKLVQYDVSFETGEIKQTLEINLDLLAPVVKLKIGDTDDICQRNLELINFAINQNNIKEPNGEYNSHFDVDINHGLGAAQFTQGLPDDSVAGYATIITAQGYINKYDIYGNGKIVKITDDIDIVDIYNKVKNI